MSGDTRNRVRARRHQPTQKGEEEEEEEEEERVVDPIREEKQDAPVRRATAHTALCMTLVGVAVVLVMLASLVYPHHVYSGEMRHHPPSPAQTPPPAAPATATAMKRDGIVVTTGLARFTVLTSQLIRMEWSPDAIFEDRPSLIFRYRSTLMPEPHFSSHITNESLTLRTDHLTLVYSPRGTGNDTRFNSKNLVVSVSMEKVSVTMGNPSTWRPGVIGRSNLGGTVRTLDRVNGAVPVDSGLVSLDGWVLVDDSQGPVFVEGNDADTWPWIAERRANAYNNKTGDLDWYFFGYGHNYRQALGDYVKLAGRIPLPPRYAFGVWWSRWSPYHETQLMALVEEHHANDIPLDVLVIDMDWHLTAYSLMNRGYVDQAHQPVKWTGYTWNTTLFPNPKRFLGWCHSMGLHTTLNLHPASGVQPHEKRYPEMAVAMGQNPATERYVPFDITNKKYASNLLDVMLRPIEEEGVDFWWLDWQAVNYTAVRGLNPTIWLNHVFFTDMEERRVPPTNSLPSRGLILHRWGGLGSHRYQIGFSGDVWTTWESLDFQVWFTLTAANVGFGFWSHDIGGFMADEPTLPELYTRWVQWGVFSPIYRTHAWRNPVLERRVWAYPKPYFHAMQEVIHLRHNMVPYLYTEARRAHDTGVALIHPMYYDYPEAIEAYSFQTQFMLGHALVSPITGPLDPKTMVATKRVWLPEGEWFEWATGRRFYGPGVIHLDATIEDIPVLFRTGSILPMMPRARYVNEKSVDPLLINVFLPHKKGTYTLYEDDGISVGYKLPKEEAAWTQINHTGILSSETVPGRRTWKMTVHAARGWYQGMEKARSHCVRLVGAAPPSIVLVNGEQIPFQPLPKKSSSTVEWAVRRGGHDITDQAWQYDGERLTILIQTSRAPVTSDTVVEMIWENAEAENWDCVSPTLEYGFWAALCRLKRVAKILRGRTEVQKLPEAMEEAIRTAHRLTRNPGLCHDELEAFPLWYAEAHTQLMTLGIDAQVRHRLEKFFRPLTE